MLMGIDRLINAELLGVLMSMGHGDDILLCDVNHPAASIARHTVHGTVVNVSGSGLAETARAILRLMPLDTFVQYPVKRMSVVGDPGRIMPIHDAFQAVLDHAENRSVGVEALERFDFYAAARSSFAVVRTSDPGPYGCFILRKGVVSEFDIAD
jgi:L-fucose mutarotase